MSIRYDDKQALEIFLDLRRFRQLSLANVSVLRPPRAQTAPVAAFVAAAASFIIVMLGTPTIGDGDYLHHSRELGRKVEDVFSKKIHRIPLGSAGSQGQGHRTLELRYLRKQI